LERSNDSSQKSVHALERSNDSSQTSVHALERSIRCALNPILLHHKINYN
jgi:hypothetical protein